MTERNATSMGTVLEAVVRCFSPEVARQVVALKPDPGLEARLAELGRKANRGSLLPDERAEYEGYVEALDIVGLLQAKARAIIKQSP
jgi:hypothetical protein